MVTQSRCNYETNINVLEFFIFSKSNRRFICKSGKLIQLQRGKKLSQIFSEFLLEIELQPTTQNVNKKKREREREREKEEES